MWSKLQSPQQVCLNMTKQASGPTEPNKQTCPNMSAHRLSNMFVKTWLKQASHLAGHCQCYFTRSLQLQLSIPPPDLFNQNRLGPTGRATCQAYASPGPLQSKPIRSHWQSTVSGCLQCIIDRPGLLSPAKQTKTRKKTLLITQPPPAEFFYDDVHPASGPRSSRWGPKCSNKCSDVTYPPCHHSCDTQQKPCVMLTVSSINPAWDHFK